MKFIFSALILFAFAGNAEESSYQKFAELLTGKDEKQNEYNKVFYYYQDNFNNRFVKPITDFAKNNIKTEEKVLFYPFAGADISYPLLFFPEVEKFLLIGLEFPGSPEVVNKAFSLEKFKPQVEGYLRSGFFKTLNMSAQMHYDQGVIPMLVTQITLLGGKVQNIIKLIDPYKGIKITFDYQDKVREVSYFRANLDDYADKTKFFQYVNDSKLIGNCMLKASSYKLQQPEFKHLRKFLLDNCNYLLQDDTGIAVSILNSLNGNIELFGNYVKPYGDEFKPYYQKELEYLYRQNLSKQHLDFCYGYGCGKVETNLLFWKKQTSNSSD